MASHTSCTILTYVHVFCTFFVLSIADVHCPDDPRLAGQQCLHHYLAITQPDLLYFSGVDVEYMRQICSALKRFAHCTRDMKHQCPGVTDDQILPDGITNVWLMCYPPSGHEFIDVYARNRNCLYRVSEISDMCFKIFNSTAPVQGNILDLNQIYLREACRTLGNLESCVTTAVYNTANTCGTEAAELVPRLVQASVSWSGKCKVPPTESSPIQASTPKFKVYQPSMEREEFRMDNHSDHLTPTVFLCIIHTVLLACCRVLLR